jgi:CheY-like chemotaxis protein
MKKILVAKTLKPFIAADGALSRNDVVISYASTTEEIISTHKARSTDLIVVDLETPKLGGDRLSYLIRRETELRAVSIIVVCDCIEEAAERCLSFGANAVVCRSGDTAKHLMAKIKELLDIRERKIVREIVKVSVTVNSAGNFFFAVAKNLSATGLLFETNRVIPRGSGVSCSFVLQRQVVAEGEIVRIVRKRGRSGDNFEYGVRFRGLDPAGKAEIEDYFKTHGRKI